MARRIKSLIFNVEDGENIQLHREHRSKKGRNKWKKGTNEAIYLYKKKKNEKFDDEDLLF